MVRRGQVYDDDDMYDWDDEEGDEEDWDAPVQPQPKGPVKGGAAARGAAAASAKPEKAAAAQHRVTHPIAPPPPLPSSLPARPATVIVQPWQAGPQTLAPSLLPAFAFTTPSPDDHVLAAQRGVGGSGSLTHTAGRAAPDNGSPAGSTSTAGSTAGGQPGPAAAAAAAAAAGTPASTQAGGGIKKGEQPMGVTVVGRSAA
ncbi:hypothetical protein QJQ45_013714 [Haematococcus lacustris]|nr:hypothetical protein QJQ45_013714 [Haematococcus lacustris]